MVGGAILASMLCIGLLLLLLLKLLAMWRNRKLYAKWREENADNLFNAADNPLFVAGNSEVSATLSCCHLATFHTIVFFSL